MKVFARIIFFLIAIPILTFMFGITLFAQQIGVVVRWLKDEESSCIRTYCITKCCINKKIFTLASITIFIAYMILDGYWGQQIIEWYYGRPIRDHWSYATTIRDNATLGDAVMAAGYISEWSMTQYIYFLWTLYTLIGFGDVWVFDDHEDSYLLVHLLTSQVLLLTITIVFVSFVAWALKAISKYFDGWVDKKIATTMHDQSP